MSDQEFYAWAMLAATGAALVVIGVLMLVWMLAS
jgi:hypothetical protein